MPICAAAGKVSASTPALAKAKMSFLIRNSCDVGPNLQTRDIAFGSNLIAGCGESRRTVRYAVAEIRIPSSVEGRGLRLKFPENREFNREFFRFRVISAESASVCAAASMIYTPIP
jgi:hypothetical protein